MNEPQSAVKYAKDFEIPADFPDILRNLTREILRENPQNIEKFGMCLSEHLHEIHGDTVITLISYQNYIGHQLTKKTISS